MRPASLHLPLRVACVVGMAMLVGCSSGGGHVRAQQQASLVEPGPDPRDDRGMYLDLIRKMQEQGAWYASLAHIQAHRQKYPESPDLRLLEAHALRETEQYGRASALYDGLTRGPGAASAWHGLGLIAARRGDDAGASNAFARAAGLDPLHQDYLGDLGFSLLRNGQVTAAREPLAKAAELAPGSAKAAANLALWALLADQASQAETIMQRAELPPESRNAVYRLAVELRQARPVPAPASAVTQAATTTASLGPAPHAARTPSPHAPVPGNGSAPLPPTLMERFHGATLGHPSEATP